MKLFDEITGTVEAVGEDGRGILSASGKPVAVSFAFPGDDIRATLVKRSRGELRGQLEEIITPSPDRVAALCKHAGTCGGCPLQALGYKAQLHWKRQFAVNAFAEAKLEVTVPEVIGSPELFHHRNRMDYVIAQVDGAARIGLKEPGRWWRTFDMDDCLMLNPDAMKAVAATKQWLAKNSIEGWDARSHSGYARYLVIREGKNTNERMAILVTKEGELPAKDELVAALSPFATTVYHAVNATITDLSIGQSYDLLAGKPFLTEEVRGKRYNIPPTAFFQTNTVGATMLSEIVEEMAALTGKETVLDLYCGVGFFAIQLATKAKRVLGVELDPEAIRVASDNATMNGVAARSRPAAATM